MPYGLYEKPKECLLLLWQLPWALIRGQRGHKKRGHIVQKCRCCLSVFSRSQSTVIWTQNFSYVPWKWSRGGLARGHEWMPPKHSGTFFLNFAKNLIKSRLILVRLSKITDTGGLSVFTHTLCWEKGFTGSSWTIFFYKKSCKKSTVQSLKRRKAAECH